jgi:hypothetical protein
MVFGTEQEAVPPKVHELQFFGSLHPWDGAPTAPDRAGETSAIAVENQFEDWSERPDLNRRPLHPQ